MSTDSFVIEVVNKLKKQGLFDQFRKECLADVDTKPAYQNLQTRVTGEVSRYLSTVKWKQDINKNQLREHLRRHLNELPMLTAGIERVVDQVVKPKIFQSLKPQIDKVVCEHLNINYDAWLKGQSSG
ncbi:hypothetical protein HELRODRAFT_63946 [Helobdella robusta]|uniref:BOD1/SHG1 domain-containing protein n=1 Tax=Helobdella robusta TaxID=6412 RepID=T1FXM7_HELRO|nr:hypothetical protein HELRODRAFT_63946 [Helobdella robusta]ESO06609.1 hypothetical protein HELRODRAFT_63946 [Helobdella robusta]